MKIRVSFFLLLIFLLFTFSSCSPAPAPPHKGDRRVVAANNKFAFDLFREVLKEDPGKNVFLCPQSAALAMAMTMNGAAGNTREAMAKVLGVEGIEEGELNRANKDLQAILTRPEKGVEVSLANSLWARQGIPFRAEFLKTNREFYQAEVRTLNFASPQAKKTIDAWVKEKTRGRIAEIAPEKIDEDTIMFLINALYFKGEWTYQFDPRQTEKAPFSLADGRKKICQMMYQTKKKFPYFRGEDFQMVSLPYGKGRLSMVIILPEEGVPLDQFCQKITPAQWEKWMQSLHKEEVEVGLPKFRIEYEKELKEPLMALGMGVAFDEKKANFTRMLASPPRGPLYLAGVKHKTFIEVDEKGTEAAGVTSVRVKLKAVPDRERMIMDRPFFYAICDNKTGAILFTGVCYDPAI